MLRQQDPMARGRQRKAAAKGTRVATPKKKQRPALTTARAAANAARRAELLDRFVDHLLDHGLAGLSLRPAAAVGTSARMLVHHFGSKENLLTQALAATRAREIDAVAGGRLQPMSSSDALFRASWQRLASSDYRRFLQLSYEMLALALRDRRRYRAFLERFTEEWRAPFAEAIVGLGFERSVADSLSTAYTAALRGLVVDLMVTGDRERVEAAVALVADRLKTDLETPR
jgi:AcrR family transcriptional regulator